MNEWMNERDKIIWKGNEMGAKQNKMAHNGTERNRMRK